MQYKDKKSIFKSPMTDNTQIFGTIESVELLAKKRTYKKRMKAAQITTLIFSLLLTGFLAIIISSGTLGAFIISLVFLVISICSFKWPFPFLLTYTILYNISILLFMLNTLISIGRTENNTSGMTVMIIADVIYVILDILIIVGTVAAKKHAQLEKQKER
jgi:lysylphosphatidylglycerol synthetase-like protein (DUF2156 family)